MTTENIDTQIVKAQQRVEKLNKRKAKLATQAELEKRKAELTRGMGKAVKDTLTALKLDIPAEGIALFIHKGENGGVLVDVKIGKGRGTDGRKSISTLGHSGFILPDGSKVASAAKVLDHFGVVHANDSSARLILTWVRDNPDKAKGVQVLIGKEKASLIEAVNCLYENESGI